VFGPRDENGCICREQYRTSHPGLELNWPIGLLNPKSAGNNRQVRKAQKPPRVHAMIFGLFHHPDFKKKDKPIIDQVSVGGDRFAGTYQDVHN
jgi:hypothetical protein